MAAPTRSRFSNLRNAFFSGALLLAPLVVTIWVFSKIIDLIGGTFRPVFFSYLPERLSSRPWVGVLLDIIATCIVIVLVTLLGYVSRDVFGKFFVTVAERVLLSIPGVGTVYISVKQVVDTFSTQKHQLFNKVVLVEFPRKGTWVVGFLTNRTQGEVQAKIDQGVVWSVFVPTTPNPTSGFLLMLPPAEIVQLDMSVGDGMKMIISGGAVVPPWPPAAAKPAGR